MNENDPKKYDDPNLKTEILRIGPMMEHLEKVRPEVVSGVGAAALADIEVGEEN